MQRCIRKLPPFSVNVLPNPTPSATPTVQSTASPSPTIISIPSATPTPGPVDALVPSWSFLWGAGSPHALPPGEDRSQLIALIHAHYSTAPTGPSSQGNFNSYLAYRNEVRALNPSANLGLYFSAVTTTHQGAETLYAFHDREFIDDDQDPSTPPRHLCEFPDYPYNLSYLQSRRPDTHSYMPVISPSSFQPLRLSDRAPDAWEPYGPAPFAWLPGALFHAQSALLPGTAIYCRPVVNFLLPSVQQFVMDGLDQALQLPEFAAATMITFDNATLVTSEFGNWPGQGDADSPFASTPPDQSFRAYLLAVRSHLNARGYHLALNGSTFSGALAGAADFIFTEGFGIQRSMSAQRIEQVLQSYRQFIGAGTAVIPYFLSGWRGFTGNHKNLFFFLATNLLVFEPGLMSFVTNLTTEHMHAHSPENALRAYSEMYIPTCLGAADGPYHSASGNAAIKFRSFQNGLVLSNISDTAQHIPGELADNLTSQGFGNPSPLAAKSGLILLRHCNCMQRFDSDFQEYCETNHSRLPTFSPLRGDLDCDGEATQNDGVAFRLYLQSPHHYSIQYPVCAFHIREVGDFDDDGLVTERDLALFEHYNTRGWTICGENQPGDMNCDGCVDNADIDPFNLALSDQRAYAELFPNCPIERADINQDRHINLFDLQPFVELLNPG